jgi:RNA polymerase sigma-70 factor, ECF subfamily
MDGVTARLTGGLTIVDDALEQEFAARLAESSTLAFRVAYGVLRHRQDAEDVAQDAFARAYANFRQLRDRDRFRGWLVRMTWRLAIDFRRGAKRRSTRESDHVAQPSWGAPGNDAASRDRVAEIWQAIDALPDKLRVVIVLANIEGHGVREVAALLEIPEGTVKSRLFLARQQLKERLS